MLNVLNKLLETDWIGYIYRKYKNISETDRKIFWILFISVNLMFCFHTLHLLWGWDDWSSIKYNWNIDNNFYEGRFASHLLYVFLFQGFVLPVINSVFAFSGFVLGTIFLFKYWELDYKVKYFVIAGLILICNPFIFSRLRCTSYLLEYLWVILFLVLGLNFTVITNQASKKERKKLSV